ncbi:MAG: DUF3795 domain-containing protein [Lentisphaeria bacterium]
MADLTHVTYCGLYCRLCGNLARTPVQASALKETLQKDGWDQWGEHEITGFKTFWDVLETLSRLRQTCKGCRGGCGMPNCAIRQCARDRNLEVCSACGDYPCAHLKTLAERYPNLISDGTRQQQVGLPQWIEEQEARCQTGACYADFRHPAKKAQSGST